MYCTWVPAVAGGRGRSSRRWVALDWTESPLGTGGGGQLGPHRPANVCVGPVRLQLSVLSIDCPPAIFDQMGSYQSRASARASASASASARARGSLERELSLVRPRFRPKTPLLRPSPSTSHLTLSTSFDTRDIRARQSSCKASLATASPVPSKSAFVPTSYLQHLVRHEQRFVYPVSGLDPLIREGERGRRRACLLASKVA